MKISILIPTRKRPDNIIRILNELKNVNIEIIIGIDIDDNSYDIDYLKSHLNVVIVRTPKTIYLSNLYNILFEYSKGDIIGYLADDLSFHNPEKFEEIRTYYETHKNHFLYYFSVCDLPYPKCVPDHAFLTRKSIKAIGGLNFFYEHGYMDHSIGRIFKETGCYTFERSENFFQHIRDGNDETYFIKSFQKDENGMTCDDRDLIIFNKFCNNYLDIHKKIIQELNA